MADFPILFLSIMRNGRLLPTKLISLETVYSNFFDSSDIILKLVQNFVKASEIFVLNGYFSSKFFNVLFGTSDALFRCQQLT